MAQDLNSTKIFELIYHLSEVNKNLNFARIYLLNDLQIHLQNFGKIIQFIFDIQ